MGFSLLEMVFATALMAGTLVPALAVMRDSLAVSRETATRALLTNYGVQKVENYTAVSIATWNVATTTENFAGDGYSNIVSIVDTSDDPSDGGLTNRLMVIDVTVFQDLNSNSTLDSGELSVSLRTKVAKLNSYENEEQ